jgi:hypothetical protein
MEFRSLVRTCAGMGGPEGPPVSQASRGGSRFRVVVSGLSGLHEVRLKADATYMWNRSKGPLHGREKR